MNESMINYWDDDGAYTHSAPGDPSVLPPENGTFESVPEASSGFWPVIDPDHHGWHLEEDHRGKEGFVDGEPIKIRKVGTLPEGWTEEPPPFVDTRPPEERRVEAYRMEADPIFEQAMKYQAAAEGLKAQGEYAEAARLEQKAHDLKISFAEKRKEIKARIPDERYCLNSSGTYHKDGCTYATEGGQRLTLEELANLGESARPCARCNPPAATKEP